MARKDNCTIMQCDRCQTLKYFEKQDDPGFKEWWNIVRFDSDGSQHDYLLCDRCHEQYVNKLKDADNEFDSWMKNGAQS
ncbi:hypothetical protein CS006_10345 [Bifidobacterium primatium]|uniref:Uncharacterized protein n=1 Tax=Bifidobacterium primatium TaxID=2045438 RepID=A0A2M9H683_9BIFI|nr:hypothetical protein [Bifidobacterium primatium]PJM72328.1 hypothetical protein CS006_10345 [Bifidobacterium primatium]